MGGVPAENTSRQEVTMPRHVAVIMDGNGRWARLRGRPRIEGHRQGAKAVRRIVRASRERGIGNLTLFAMSTENLRRPPAEVSALFHLLRRYLLQEAEEMRETGIRFTLMGDHSQLPKEVIELARDVERTTAGGNEMSLTIAVAYGGREDLLEGVRALQECGDPVSAEGLEQHLWSSHLPPVDLLIRTGGERRISNFMLWHLAYAELCFTDKHWPDFHVSDYDRAISDFARRQRRFGQVP